MNALDEWFDAAIPRAGLHSAPFDLEPAAIFVGKSWGGGAWGGVTAAEVRVQS